MPDDPTPVPDRAGVVVEDLSALVAPRGERLDAMHRGQVRRDPWPAWEAYEPREHPLALRRGAAVQWAGRARNELASVHQFSSLAHVLCELGAPLEVHGALARLITDEVRHVELCARAALALWPEGPAEEPRVFRRGAPKLPWGQPPEDEAGRWVWACDAVLTACCLGETLSRPMLEAIATVSTDPLPEGVARQILRDEHLHATFGWEAARVLLPRLDAAGREQVQARLARRLASFERTTCGELRLPDLVGEEVLVERGQEPNLGTLSAREYAAIFYSTMESEILPGLEELGLDAMGAWSARA